MAEVKKGDRLAGKVAVVVGAGSSGPGWGNGKAAAVLYARQGAKVFAVDINAAAAAETAAIITSEGGHCTAHVADVTKSDEVKAMVDACVKTYGRIDVLHNNVGLGIMGGPVETSEADWNRGMAVGVTSMFLTCKHAIPVMERQGGGAIVNISSIAGITHLGYDSLTYSAAKGAVNQLTRNIAIKYAPKGIRANAVLPGLMNTPLIHREVAGRPGWARAGFASREDYIAARDAQVPMRHMGDAWDVAYAALFLASDEARYITAAELIVDGGITSVIPDERQFLAKDKKA